MLTYDTRELRSTIPDKLKELLPTVRIVEERLVAGDYLWHDVDGQCIIVERKSINDLLSSVASERLEEQLEKLRVADVKVLLLEGTQFSHDGILYTASSSPYPWRKGMALLRCRQGGWKEGSYLGILWRICYGAGVLLLPSISRSQSAHLLAIAYQQSLSLTHSTLFSGSKGYKYEKMDDYTRAVSLVERCGARDASELRRMFPTLSSLAQASLEALVKVRGVGEVKGKRIWRFFNEEHNEEVKDDS